MKSKNKSTGNPMAPPVSPAPPSPMMQRALALARTVMTTTTPNPRVGCVICAPDGTVLGEGATQPAGQAHAEIMALRQAQAMGHSTQGATAYVTLEPCSHHGSTGPCCDALVQAGIAHVVASLQDPNPRVAGQGFAKLQAAGVTVARGDGAAEAIEINIGFISRMVRKTPWVRLKIAASLDGQTALENGQSQWITGSAARADGHAWRARACAVLTGIGTVVADNPRLDVRLVDTARQPRLVLVDSQLDVSADAQLFQPRREVLVYCAQAPVAKVQALQALGITVIALPNSSGKVDLSALLQDLAQRGVNELHVEAGHKLNGSLLREGLVDELLVYLAPLLIGQGQPMSAFGPLSDLSDALPLQFHDVAPIGPDLRLLARLQGRGPYGNSPVDPGNAL
jgi:diaminohydroxyphosphoribosylaminopyrimidine deaminase / 5-amino-6-(5-phosphoribosylamino)uracil reductase